MTKTLYIGIDVSKSKLDTSTTINPKHILAFSTFENNPTSFKKLYNWVNEQKKKFRLVKMHFCIESTGIYSEEIAEYLQEQKNTIVSVVNPAQTKAFACSILLRTKNDKVDSKMLAFYCCINNPKEMVKPSEELIKLKKLARYESFLIDYCACLKTKLSSEKDLLIRGSIISLISCLNNQINDIERLIMEHINNFKDLKKSFDLLNSIKNIGAKTAYRILTEIIPEEELTVKAQIAHAGLAPSQKLSGTSIHGKPKISKIGNSRLRKYLYMPTVGAIVNNPLIREFYERLISKGKCEMLALTACMRKLLAIAIGVLRNKQPFDLNWAMKKQLEYANVA